MRARPIDIAALSDAGAPPVELYRYEMRVRSLTVIAMEQVTPALLRITLSGDLNSFESRGFDDHVKLILHMADGSIERRDYTPRRFDRAASTLAIDFALHEAGPATTWARSARRGDRLDVVGPKGSRLISNTVRRWLLIGDETALPAIGRKLEEAAPDMEITTVVAVTNASEEQRIVTAADARLVWTHRPPSAAADAGALLAALGTVDIRPSTFVWIAAEAAVARAVRECVAARGQPIAWLKASGYWVAGQSDAHVKID